MDPHTATAIKAYEYLKEKGKINNKVIAYSTAEWTKFAPSVYNALVKENQISDKEAIAYIESHYQVKAPKVIKELFEKEVNEDIINKDEIKEKIIEFIKN